MANETPDSGQASETAREADVFVLPLKMPSAMIRLWVGDSSTEALARGDVEARIEAYFEQVPRVFVFTPQLIAVPPVEGDPAVFDTALQLCTDLLKMDLGMPLRILILPGEIDIRSQSVHLVPDPLLEDFVKKAPELSPDTVHMTARACRALEGRVTETSTGTYAAASGPLLPISRVADLRYEIEPWRNPEILGRRLPMIPRPELTTELESLLGADVLRISGPIGCGKTRLLWATLQQNRRSILWTCARSSRSLGPTIAQQVIEQVQRLDSEDNASEGIASTDQLAPLVREWEALDRSDQDAIFQATTAALLYRHQIVGRPIDLVVDELESISPADLALLARIHQDSLLKLPVRLILVRRSGGTWPEIFADAPSVAISPFDDATMSTFADKLLTGLSLPKVVRDRLVDASTGYPFALEEGAIAMIHARSLRRIYGSFFFGGDEKVDYLPSLRLVRHLRAEAERLGAAFPVHVLSLLDAPIPPAQLRETATALGSQPLGRWTAELVSAQLLEVGDSPWGDGMKIECRAYAKALAYVVPPDTVPRVRQEVARRLSAVSRNGDAKWSTYRILRETEHSIPILLDVLTSNRVQTIPHEELIEALVSELHRLRARGEDPDLELELLWRLLPIVRKTGQLTQHYDELNRGFALSIDDPDKLVALAGLKAEIDRKSGRLADAEAALQLALKKASGVADRRRALLLIELGRVLLFQARYDEAQYLLLQLRRTLNSDQPDTLRATCDFFLGNIALHQNKLEVSRSHHETALAERRELNLSRPLGKSLSALGAITTRLGNYPQALEYYGEARDVLSEHGKTEDLSFVLLGIGRALSRLGDYTGATQPLREGLAIRRNRDDLAGEAIARLMVAENHFHLGRLDEALQETRQAKFDFRILSLNDNLAETEQLLARIRLRQRKIGAAQAHLKTARALRDNRASAAALIELAWYAEVALAVGNRRGISEAKRELEEALGELGQAELRELLDFRLYRCQKRMGEIDNSGPAPLTCLKRAYDRLLAKASHLSPELRHRFLFQIPENREIVDAATQAGLSIAAIQTDLPTAPSEELDDGVVQYPPVDYPADR